MRNIDLNDNQTQAIHHFKGPMMVLAGPGSGKTTVITYRIQNLIDEFHVNPRDILVITFTKASAEEMRKRFEDIVGGRNGVTFGTFHSVFFRIIRSYYGYTVENVLKEDEKREALKHIANSMELNQDEEEDFIQGLVTEISLIKNELIDIQYYHSTSIGAEDFTGIYKAYEKFKKKNNKIDFDDMLVICHQLLSSHADVLATWRSRYQFTLIDEFQDINKVQYETIKMLVQPECNLFIVGDDDQSIYKFRGARPEFLLRFPDEYGEVKRAVLDINYRSTDRIIGISNKIISQNKRRYEKSMKGTKGKGTKPLILTSEDIGKEAVHVGKIIQSMVGKQDLDEIAIIYRTNMQGRAFIDILLNMHIPFQVKDDFPGIYSHWVCKDLCAYMKLALNRNLDGELERIINKPKRYISKGMLYAAKKKSGGLLSNLYGTDILQLWQVGRIEELMFYLNSIKQRNAYDAIKYIRHGVGYNDYIKEYADYRRISHSGLFEILDELQEAAKGVEGSLDLNGFLAQVDLANAQGNSKTMKNAKNQTGVTLTTMHSAKGLEYDVVFIAGAVEGVIPHEKSKTDAEIEEERRLFYVAMTRAKEKLYFSVVKSRYEAEVKPTRFLG